MGMSSYTKILRFLFLFLVIGGVFCILQTPVASAAGAGGAITFPVGIERTIADFVSKAISMINVFIWIIFVFLNFVLDPAFIFDLDASGQGSFMDMLNRIWQLSRDLMNIGFALALVGTAIYTIIMADKEFVTKHAKKFVLAVILVNFSWFFPRVIMDVANVAAATVYGIPSLITSATQQQCAYRTGVKEIAACKTITAGVVDPSNPANNRPAVYMCPCTAVVDVAVFVSDQDRIKLKANGWTCNGTTICTQRVPLDQNTVSGFSAILNGLIVNHARLSELATVPPPIDPNKVSDMVMFLIREMLILVIHIALFFPLLAMLVAFVIRIPVLWVTIAFMPFIFVSWVTDNGTISEYPKKLWESFLKAAFLPAMVAVPLSVGFVLVNAGAQLTPRVNGLNIQLLSPINNFWDLLWLCITLGVIWMGVFAVLEKGGIMATGTQAIKGFGKSLGSLALKAPLAAPIIPGLNMTPLAALKKYNPRSVEAGISGSKGLRGFAENDAESRRGIQNASAAQRLAGNSADVDKLHTDLQHLLAAVQADKAAGTTTQQEAVLRRIKTDHSVDLTSGNLNGDLSSLLDQIKNRGLAPGSAGFDKLKKAADDIKTAKQP